MQFTKWNEIESAVGVLCGLKGIEAPKTYAGHTDHGFVYDSKFEIGIKKLSKRFRLFSCGCQGQSPECGVPSYTYDFREETHLNKLLDEIEESLGEIDRTHVEYNIELVKLNQSKMLYFLTDDDQIASFLIYTPKTLRRSNRIAGNQMADDSYWSCESYINVVCTHPYYQGLGLARKLIDSVNRRTRNWCRKSKSGMARMSLHPIDDNVKSMYKHIGFVNDGACDSMVTNNLMVV